MDDAISALNLLNSVDAVVQDPLRFKARLEIGDQAFTSLTLRNKAFELWDVVGVASTGAKFAGSAAVASTFFSSTSGGFLGFFAITSATTPIGWIIGASVVSGGAYYGLIRYFKGMDDSRVEVIPKFINTPIDVLAIGLFDFIAPLSLKVAAADGDISPEELEVIKSYFVDGWGYDPRFVDGGLDFFAQNIDQLTLKELTQGLREFTLGNKDCNHKKIRERVVTLLRDIAEADGRLHEMEELAIEHVAQCLPKDPWFQMPKIPKMPKLPSLPSWPRKSS